MSEMLIVLAIMAIIMAVAIPEVIVLQRKLRQTELDAKAETIYVAAQNVLSKLKATGRSSVYEYTAHGGNFVIPLDDIPGDAKDTDNIDIGDICYITSETLTQANSAASVIMSSDNLEDELRENHWVIEYNPSSAIVYAVFYSETLANCAQEYMSDYHTYDFSLRYKENRYTDGARVGYYGGGNADSGSVVNKITPKLNIVNAEKLVANISCTLPSSVKDYPVFKVVLEDSMGHAYTKYYAYWACSAQYKRKIEEEAAGNDLDMSQEGVQKKGRKFTLELMLDDLSTEASRFVNVYGAKSAHAVKLDAGTPLKVTVTAMCPGNYTITQNLSVSQDTNSLFADESTNDHAVISFGRHLQNLDGASGVVSAVTTAEQVSDINFTDVKTKTGLLDWYETYQTQYFNGFDRNTPLFKPIDNAHLESYDGKAPNRIVNLFTKDKEDAGLFKILYDNQTVKNVILTGTIVTSLNGGAGSIAGAAKNATIENCLVYLTPSDLLNKNNHDEWITGQYAGGLVGIHQDGTLTIKNSGAATVIGKHGFDYTGNVVTSYGCESAGGLVGIQNTGSFVVENSYADCYIVADYAGGLAGTLNGSSSLTNCYSAGFLTSRLEGAGFVLGQAYMKNSYTIMYKNYMKSSKIPYYQTAKAGVVSGHVYYASSSANLTGAIKIAGESSIGTLEIKDMTAKLNETSPDAFKFDTTDTATNAYNLMGQSLDAYTFPELTTVLQYGDWKADFQVGALVYYEKYQDYHGMHTYGFFGANVDSTLKDDPHLTVVGDGYGVVYPDSQETLPKKVTITIDGVDTVIDMESADTRYYVVHGEQADYRIYPIRVQNVNTVNAVKDFYHKVKVQRDDAENKADYYYYNPHFAKMVVYMTDQSATVPDMNKNTTIAVRTARHLYMLSEYYSVYADKTALCTYAQERNIDYARYDWKNFSTRTETGEELLCQKPISENPDGIGVTPFRAIYDGRGNWIMDVSFKTRMNSYVGMFGKSTGLIENVVLRSNFSEEEANNFYVAREGTITNNQTVCLGVLLGENEGYVYNCAVAGYYLAGTKTLHAYQNSTLYAGGLVGNNKGSIAYCSADIPFIRLSTTYANVSMGGFAGSNSSYIEDCYALGHLEVAFASGGRVDIAGFAGKNSGVIRNAYCVTALTASGLDTTSYGFAPKGGESVNCTYLNNGSYSYVHHMYSYNFESGIGTPVRLSQMKLPKNHGERAVASYDFSNTETISNEYPFRAVVHNPAGVLVHYGEWIDDEILGPYGIFYWELEEQGSNNGYHITYLGTNEDKPVANSTLCISHDDGGVITQYGYGYYEMEEGSVTLSMKDSVIDAKTPDTTGLITFDPEVDAYNVAASNDLASQINVTHPDGSESQYHFYAFTTRTQEEAAGGEYLCFSGRQESNSGNRPNVQNSTWTLTYKPGTADEKAKQYTVSPFFANALSTEDGITINGYDFSKIPGRAEHPYEIRSAKQLQFINWNYEKQSYSSIVDSANNDYKKYNYLMYTNNTNSSKQTLANAYNNTVNFWNQTHDLNAKAEGMNLFTPIAGQVQACKNISGGNYDAVIYAWFGGRYNGQSYKIMELNINTKSAAVGLFGIVAGTRLENILMHSNEGAQIVRETLMTDLPTSYSIGGLAGVAYRYNNTDDTQEMITNCTISGYRVIDNSKNTEGRGEANVGGLIGVCKLNIEKCAAIADIEVNCTHFDTSKPGYNHTGKGTTKSGDYIRVGGLVGAAQYNVNNCYTGGSCKVSKELLDENYDSSRNHIDSTDTTKKFLDEYSANVYIAGIVGCAFTCNYRNFTGVSSSPNDGQAKLNITNCYTYFRLPAYEGTIRSMALLGSVADRDSTSAANITMDNCYYLDTCAKVDISNAPEFKGANNVSIKKMLEDMIPEADVSKGFTAGKLTDVTGILDMLNGGWWTLNKIQHNSNNHATFKGTAPVSVTYEELSKMTSTGENREELAMNERLGDAWSWVTTLEGSQNIDGKYSFPSSASLIGKNYPFPTVLTQKDMIFGGQVNVHYGDWPINGPAWENGRDKMDIFADMQSDGYATKVFKLYTKGKNMTMPAVDRITMSDGNLVEVVSIGALETDANGTYYPVTIRALNTGTVEITAQCLLDEGTPDEILYPASFTVEITANIHVVPDVSEIALKVGKKAKTSFAAVTKVEADGRVAEDALHYEINENSSWELIADIDNVVALKQGSTKPNEFTIERIDVDEVLLNAVFTYDYHGVAMKSSGYLSVLLLPPTLTLMNDVQVVATLDVTEKNWTKLPVDVSVSGTVEGFEFYGWYTSMNMEEADRVLDAQGNVIAEVAGITSLVDEQLVISMIEDKTLYAGFRKESELYIMTDEVTTGEYIVVTGNLGQVVALRRDTDGTHGSNGFWGILSTDDYTGHEEDVLYHQKIKITDVSLNGYVTEDRKSVSAGILLPTTGELMEEMKQFVMVHEPVEGEDSLFYVKTCDGKYVGVSAEDRLVFEDTTAVDSSDPDANSFEWTIQDGCYCNGSIYLGPSNELDGYQLGTDAVSAIFFKKQKVYQYLSK